MNNKKKGEIMNNKEEITSEIEKCKSKKILARKISSKANRKKDKWTELSFPTENKIFDYVVAPANVLTSCAGLVAGGAIAVSNGENQMGGMLIGTAVGFAVLPIACLAVGGVRRATQLIADKCYKKFDLKQKQLTRAKNKMEQTSSQEL